VSRESLDSFVISQLFHGHVQLCFIVLLSSFQFVSFFSSFIFFVCRSQLINLVSCHLKVSGLARLAAVSAAINAT